MSPLLGTVGPTVSDLATLIMAWAGVHVIIGIHNLTVYARRSTDLEYLAYATLSFSFATYSWGAALLTDASSVADGVVAMRIAYVGAPLAMGSFVAFAASLFGNANPRFVLSAVLWALLGLVLNLAGLFFDPDTRALASGYFEPQQTPVAVVWVLGTCAFLAWTLFSVLPDVRRDRLQLLLGVGAALMVGAAAHDQALHFGAIEGAYWMEHGAVATTLLFSYMMLRRLAGTELELERRTAEVRASYLDLKRAQDALVHQEQLAAVGELSAVIAHEIRNPLAILTNATSALRRPRLSGADRATLLSILSEETGRLRRLAKDLASYAQPVMPVVVPFQISSLLSHQEQRATEEGPEGLVVSLSVPEDVDRIEADPKLLARALGRLTDNALQAMPEGGELSMRTERAVLQGKPALVVIVTDRGEGMNSLVRDKAIDPFFTTRASGTGLGLAVVDRIIRAHRGSLEIESTYGQGTTVRMTIPRAPA